MASGNGIGDRTARPYRKHKPLPALIVIGVLAVGAIIVWVNAVVSKGDVDEAVRCDPPANPAPGTVFTPLPHNALDDRPPLPPNKVSVRVYNASLSRGRGSIATTSLKELGFTGTGEPGNDAAYQGREAKCRGQIRFGENGRTAARTISLVVPCAELVQDNRKDASVDLITGTLFGDIQPRAEALQVLNQLAEWSKANPGGGGNEQSAGVKAPAIDQTLLSSARDVAC